jgi:hypothetical protein
MAGGKDQAEDVVIDHLVKSLIHCFTEPLLLQLQLPPNLSMLLLQHSTAAHRVDGAPLCRCHQPRRRLFWDTFVRPLFESCHESVLSEFLGDADIAGDAGNPGDETCGLDLPHGLDRFMRVLHA